jgi:hypothetical protein
MQFGERTSVFIDCPFALAASIAAISPLVSLVTEMVAASVQCAGITMRAITRPKPETDVHNRQNGGLRSDLTGTSVA